MRPQAAALKELLDQPALQIMPGCGDGMGAHAVEACIAAAPKVLWLADGDTGYGNALAVQKAIRAYARRGAAAVLIEDKAWPRPLGHQGAKLVIERVAAILRCRAAV